MKRISLALVLAVSGAAMVIGCGEKANTGTGTAPPPTQRGGAALDAGAPIFAKAPDFNENDFIENDHNRDPFRSYATLFVEKAQSKAKNQLPVILPQYSIDELKLVAIVLGGEYPRAMLLDPRGVGWVVHRGDYVGRPDTVHTGGTNGTDYQLNWRVDRVRDGDIVLSREDRASGAPPATRVIPLHPEKNENGGEGNDQRL